MNPSFVLILIFLIAGCVRFEKGESKDETFLNESILEVPSAQPKEKVEKIEDMIGDTKQEKNTETKVEEPDTQTQFEKILQMENTTKLAEQISKPLPKKIGPPNPEIHQVRIITGTGRELRPSADGFYEIPTRIPNFFLISADNKGNPFQLRIRSPVITFGRAGFSLNLRAYADTEVKSKHVEGSEVYYLDVETPLQNDQYPYFFIVEELPSSKKHHFFITLVDPNNHMLKSQEVDIKYQLV